VIFFFVFFALGISFLLAYNNYSALGVIQRQTHETFKSTLSVQESRLNDGLSSTELFLLGFLQDSADVAVLEKNEKNTSEWFFSLNRLQKKFDSAMPTQIADGYFLRFTTQELFIHGNSTIKVNLKSKLRDAIDQGLFFTEENAGKWIVLEADGSRYFARAIKNRSGFIGAWVSVDGVISELFGKESGSAVYSFADFDENLLSGEKRDGSILISVPVKNENFSIVAILDKETYQETRSLYLGVILIVAGGVAALLFTTLILLQISVLNPIKALTLAIKDLQKGNITAHVKERFNSKEFNAVKNAFNDMVKEIRQLKIGAYEEKLHHRQVEIEYLKLQSTPHFIINCLNTVYQLSEIGSKGLTRSMIRGLSSHLRYTLSSGEIVMFEQEVSQVENYIEMSSIRYPNAIKLFSDYSPEVGGCAVVPLIVLTFVENAVKYEAVLGKTLEIHVSAKMSNELVAINIWDTGEGFPDEARKIISEGHNRRHIGIKNVIQRANLVLGSASFSFSNREGAGAQVDILIPHKPI
jgi:two-component system sensor histidine kinase YesM